MGQILTPIAVDLDQVSAVVGSKTKRLVSTLVKKFGNEFDQIDEMALDFADEGEEPLTVRDALTHLVMGDERNDELGFLYGYAVEFICQHFGEMLPNREWSAMPSAAAYAEKVDKALKAAGVGEKAFRMNRLLHRGAPIPLPEIEDYPGIGYLRVKEIDVALKEFDVDKLATVKDKEIRASLAEARGWLTTCAGEKWDLICFYS